MDSDSRFTRNDKRQEDVVGPVVPIPLKQLPIRIGMLFNGWVTFVPREWSGTECLYREVASIESEASNIIMITVGTEIEEGT